MPIKGATVQLQKNDNGTWVDVSLKNGTTHYDGAYSMSVSELLGGTYQYRTTYAGNETFAGNCSTAVTVTVINKASVLADFETLKAAVTATPNSAFVVLTKPSVLTGLSLIQLQVSLNRYNEAATNLQTKILPTLDGCTNGNRPDSNDAVRTCPAQALLYPQVLNLIKELNALSGL